MKRKEKTQEITEQTYSEGVHVKDFEDFERQFLTISYQHGNLESHRVI